MELSENMLQNIFLNLPPQTVLFSCTNDNVPVLHTGGRDLIGGGIQGRAASYEHYASTGFLWSWNFAISRRWKVRRLRPHQDQIEWHFIGNFPLIYY